MLTLRCPVCKQVFKLKGQPLKGQLVGKQVLRLDWPTISTPVLMIGSRLKAGCAARPHKRACLRLKSGATLELTEMSFNLMARAPRPAPRAMSYRCPMAPSGSAL